MIACKPCPRAQGSQPQLFIDDYAIDTWRGVVRLLLPPSSRRVALSPEPPTDSRFGCPCSVVHASVQSNATTGTATTAGAVGSAGPRGEVEAASGRLTGAHGGTGRARQPAQRLPSAGGVRLWHTSSFEGGDAAHFEWEDGKKKVPRYGTVCDVTAHFGCEDGASGRRHAVAIVMLQALYATSPPLCIHYVWWCAIHSIDRLHSIYRRRHSTSIACSRAPLPTVSAGGVRVRHSISTATSCSSRSRRPSLTRREAFSTRYALGAPCVG